MTGGLLGAPRPGQTGAEVALLPLPHRYADAYLLNSLLDGERFDRTPPLPLTGHR